MNIKNFKIQYKLLFILSLVIKFKFKLPYKIFILNNWYTIETQPIDPFVLEGLPLFTIFLFRG